LFLSLRSKPPKILFLRESTALETERLSAQAGFAA
jgi:hypothetical protein